MRSWTGCITCRTRKVKCDETRPTCDNCRKTQVECIPCEPVSFRYWCPLGEGKDNIWVSIDSNYRFIDETDGIAAEYTDISCSRTPSTTDQINDSEQHLPLSCEVHGSGSGESSTSGWRQSPFLPLQPSPQQAIHPQEPALTAGAHFHSREAHDSIEVDIVPFANQPGQIHHPYSPNQKEVNAHDDRHVYSSSAITNEGAQALLSMRHATCSSHNSNNTTFPFFTTLPSNNISFPSQQTTPDEFQTPQPLTSADEASLLRQFCAEVGQWMDLSDLSMTFSKKVCQLATQDPLLKAAAIACAAKQLHLKWKRESDGVIAGKNYNKAISLLICRLGKTEHPYASHGFAATVMCSCYEMMETSSLDWQKHLEGVFTLGKVRSINGSCGGIEQAGFWSIARQEVVCSIMNRRVLRLDPDLWAVDLENIGKEGQEDLINNQVLTILAKIVNFIAKPDDVTSPASKEARAEEWQKLLAHLQHWEQSVKGFMGPAAVYKENGKAFLTIWFTRSVCASSWQMYHLAHILLSTTNPHQDKNCMLAFQAVESDLLYHAREICGIAQSKPHGNCRVNSVQPLYYAGCCFSDAYERGATARLLEDIEDDLGWAAKYRARELQKR